MDPLLEKYFPALTADQKKKFERLPEIYSEWNQKINLISRKETEMLMERHVLHSLAIAKFISFTPNTQILDVGTGGGFPGIPLAIFFPMVKFHLVDSIGKKIMVVKDVINQLNLNNAFAENIRAEELKDNFDFIVSRAVAPVEVLLRWTGNKLKKKGNNSIKNGFIFLKGGELQEEIIDYPTAQVYEIKDYFEEEFFETKKIVYLPAFSW